MAEANNPQEAKKTEIPSSGKIKGLIFDFDGLLVNTQELVTESWEEVLKMRGRNLALEDREIISGRSGATNANYLVAKYKLEDNPDEFLRERIAISNRLFENNVSLMKGAKSLLENARNWNLVCAIASSGFISIIEPILDKFQIRDYFEVVVTVEDLKGPGKPDPEVFQLAAEKLGLDPKQCVVLEDAENGIAAAKAAGMKSVLVAANHQGHMITDADFVLKDLHQFTPQTLKALNQ